MRINANNVEWGDETYDSLTTEQQEMIDFLNKRDWEGGNDGLWGHSGSQYFPTRLKPLAEAYGKAMDDLDKAVYDLMEELEIDY